MSAIARTLYLSHFTPSMMAPETLEAMLVQREPVLTRALDHVVESLRTGSRHHTLFVGPRGIGKTHLISLLHHRLIQTQEAKDEALIAWMREEEWGVTSFFELVMRILRTLDATYPQFNITERTQPLYDLKVDEAAKQAEALLLDVLAGKCLVILMENLDDLFDQIGDQGQKAWRAFIQNHGNMLLVCTTPSLFAGVSIHKSAFYGFFDIEPLAELEFEDVVSLLRKIAVERGDADLANFIDTPEGRARIRAVHHLAEGNPRIYIIFAQFLSHEALDELVQAFMHTLDELTPYYQARMKELSGQQRKILTYLIHHRVSAPVKQIAAACFITQQVCSSQLKQLRDKRYVRAIGQGRESYYELCEPMMRLCMDVKNQRGEPVSLFVDFLRIWYSRPELEAMLQDDGTLRHMGMAYIEKALMMATEKSDPKVVAIEKELDKASATGQLETSLSLLQELETIDLFHGKVAWIRFGLRLLVHPLSKALATTNIQLMRGYAVASHSLSTAAIKSMKTLGNQSPEYKALVELGQEIEERNKRIKPVTKTDSEEVIHANQPPHQRQICSR
jgi:DNA polymerase III delta prime subunit